ncbi:MAG: hypothetical protein FJ146_18640, partial [Deltaproteobacteria bacterium]|nr:hypothetical protein [Deltaproteobacteria bacterium]
MCRQRAQGYLRCGVLQCGFLRTKGKACDFERAVPFSCKGRGFCPSCCCKRMAEKAHTKEAIPRFIAFEPPTDQEVCDVVEKIATKTIKFLRKKGYLQEEGEEVLRPD